MYNKNNLSLIPFTTKITHKLINNFFNFYNKNLEKKIRIKRLLLRLRRLSSNKIYISKGEFKHTNNNVLVNLYIYNKQKNNYLSKLKNIYLQKLFSLASLRGGTMENNNINMNLVGILKKIRTKGLDNKNLKNKHMLIKAINIIGKNPKYKIENFKYLSSYMSNFYKNLLKKSLKRLRMFYLYKQLLYINRSKLNYTYLILLKKYLEKLYNKNVIFNLINLKRFYLSSDIFSESVKLKITRNRRKLRRILKKVKNKIVIRKQIHLTNYLYKPVKAFIKNEKKVIKTMKYKHITGFRIETKGRLTRRNTASRSMYKLDYKGNLIDLNSSRKGLSSVILKGNMKPNIQYTKLNSKTRIGSFGLKG